MDMIISLKQWVFERLLSILCLGAVGGMYQIGSIWYANLRMIGNAYGISI